MFHVWISRDFVSDEYYLYDHCEYVNDDRILYSNTIDVGLCNGAVVQWHEMRNLRLITIYHLFTAAFMVHHMSSWHSKRNNTQASFSAFATIRL